MDLSSLVRRVANLVVVGAVRSDGAVSGCHRGQITGRHGETKDGIRILLPFGFSHRVAGGDTAETVMIAVEPNLRYALPPHDKAYQPDDLAAGEVAIYNADDGSEACRIHFKRGRVIEILAKTVTVKADEVARIEGKTVEIHAAETLKLDCGGNGAVWTPSARTDYVIGAGSATAALHPDEVP